MLLFSDWLLWLAALSLAGWLYLIFGRGAFWHAESLPDPAVPSLQHLPDVVAVVPARNEATYVGRTLPSLIAQDYPGRVCVILVDDNSEDRTRAIAEAMATRPGRLLEVIGARRGRPVGRASCGRCPKGSDAASNGCRTRRMSCSPMPTCSTIPAISDGWSRKRKRTGSTWSRSCSGCTASDPGSGC